MFLASATDAMGAGLSAALVWANTAPPATPSPSTVTAHTVLNSAFIWGLARNTNPGRPRAAASVPIPDDVQAGRVAGSTPSRRAPDPGGAASPRSRQCAIHWAVNFS